jgi:YidC/Oxa1 family membrane protein insertase
MILAIVLTGLLLFGWDAVVRYIYPQPAMERQAAERSAAAPSTTAAAPTREGGLTDPADRALEVQDLKTALAAPDRVPIVAPGLSGSINLTGALVDDLTVNRHTESVDDDSGPVRIFSPAGTPAQQFAQFGWVSGAGGGNGIELPTAGTEWTAPDNARLTPQSPVTVTWNNSTGQAFAIRYAIDTDYMITATATMANRGEAPVAVKPFALLNRTDKTAAVDGWNIHSGPFGAFNGEVSFGPDYDDLGDAREIANSGRTNWIGFTDIYWMSTLIPDSARATSAFRSLSEHIYRADVVYEPQIVAPGQSLTRTTRLFAGAKESPVLDRYEQDLGIANFGLAIDWGWFRWFEKPIFWLLTWLFDLVKNFGVAIILLTVIVRAIMFPIAQRQFASMAQMRAIQPKMKALQERYKDDKPKLQEETMKLYREEKVNPLAGCLPILLQIPVFFALYKVLMVSVEMRHQPFLWMQDLSVPDPLHILNLFGLLPFTVPSFLAIGVLAVLLGLTMWLQFRLNPAPMDPIQQQVFAIMPWMMMFIMAPFAAGLLVYWITSNILTIAQQAYLYSKHPQLKVQAAKDGEDAKRAEVRAK